MFEHTKYVRTYPKKPHFAKSPTLQRILQKTRIFCRSWKFDMCFLLIQSIKWKNFFNRHSTRVLRKNDVKCHVFQIFGFLVYVRAYKISLVVFSVLAKSMFEHTGVCSSIICHMFEHILLATIQLCNWNAIEMQLKCNWNAIEMQYWNAIEMQFCNCRIA